MEAIEARSPALLPTPASLMEARASTMSDFGIEAPATAAA